MKKTVVSKTLKNSEIDKIYKAGFVAIVGAPNAGKSTLLNRLLGEKVAIVAAKPQTTRHRILGVMTEERGQIIFWDTPGLHRSTKLLNQEMNNRALAALADADVCLLVVDGDRRGPEHVVARELVSGRGQKPLLAVINKSDLLSREREKELLASLEEEFRPEAGLCLSARTGQGFDLMKKTLFNLLPENPPFYPDDTLTDQSVRNIAAELVREAVFRLTRQEIPYSTAVTVDEFIEPSGEDGKNLYSISATIHVEKENQKGVMIGHHGRMLRVIGQTARLNIERLLDGPVFLKLFVRTTKDWSHNKRDLLEFGYMEPGSR